MDLMKPMMPMEPMHSAERWWPSDLGDPSTSGSQNEIRYAFFRSRRRLAVEREGELSIYDTGDHSVEGVSQVTAATGSVEFTTREGALNLDELEQVD
jgi:hypothetical protein